MAQRKPIFQLKADYDPTEFILVRLTTTYADGRIIKRDAPTMDGSSIEVVLYCIREFDDLASELELNTGNELFHNFRRLLRGSAKDEWDLLIASIGNYTQANFRTTITRWKSEMILPTSRQALVDYLESLSKPRSMSVESFVNRLKVMIRYIADIPFPGPEPPLINQTKLKSIIFKAMPDTWQTNFLRSNGDMSTSSVLTLQQFMSQEQEIADRAQNTQNTRGNFNNRNNKRERSGRGFSRGNGGRNNYQGRRHTWNNDSRNVRPRVAATDSPCRTHNGSHMWSQCRTNPNSTNYIPNSTQGRGPYTRGGNNGRNTNGRGRWNNNYQHRTNSTYVPNILPQPTGSFYQNMPAGPFHPNASNQQLVPYIPSGAGRTQGYHSNGTWNNENGQQEFQSNSPNAYFHQNGR